MPYKGPVRFEVKRLGYPMVMGWFRLQLHNAFGDAAYRRMQRYPRCTLPFLDG